MPNVSFKSDLHPYECGQNCIHCRKVDADGHNPVDCAFCWDDLLTPETAGLYLAIFTTWPGVPLLRSHCEFDVTHRGQEYTVFCDGEAATEYLKDEWLPIYRDRPSPDTVVVGDIITYRFRLTGAHGGPPIEILMVYPRDEGDGEGGRDFVWDALLWADDHVPFNHHYFLDAYTDPLRDELTEIAKSWD